MDQFGINIWNFLIQLGAFLVFAFLLWRFAVGPIVRVLDARQDKISESLLAAERMQVELRESQAKNEQVMAEARREASELMQQARSNADAVEARAREKAEASAQEFLDRAQQTLQQETAQARQQLRQEVADLAVMAAGQIIHKEITPEDQRAIIEQTLSGSANSELPRQ